jgi:hypothetical protein
VKASLVREFSCTLREMCEFRAEFLKISAVTFQMGFFRLEK